jgi:hypothetical protein
VSSRRKLQREVRNGKAVYVPQSSLTASRSSHSAQAGPRRIDRTSIHLARLLWFACFGAIAGLLWLSIQYLINPDVAFWLDHGLLGSTRSRQGSREQPLRLKKIQSALKAEGLFAGQPMILKSNFTLQPGLGNAATIAIPVSKGTDAACRETCGGIQQLRIYRSLQLPFLIRMFQGDPYFRLTDAIAIQGPSESDLRTLDNNPLVSQGSDQPLPITQSEIYERAPEPGLWLRLVGLQTQGSSVSTYGQVFYFNPLGERLELMLNWVSPPGEVPQWQQVTGDGQPELVINQTVGLEPQYGVYQLQFANSVAHQLRRLTLDEPAFESPAYTDALTLARSGLWTPAETMLKQVKQNNPKSWNATAQGQLDYIHLHARVTQAQAAQPSASGVQRIMGYLINGSWTAALNVLQSDRTLRPELREMLLSDSGRLTNRIDTALRVMPGNADVIEWGALLRLSRNSSESAITWTQQQSRGNGATVAKVQKLLKQMEQPKPAIKPTASPNATPKPKPKPSPQSSSQPKIVKPSPSPSGEPSPSKANGDANDNTGNTDFVPAQ